MKSMETPLPIGEVPPGPYGPQEIIVYRLSDPVLVRRAGETAGYPLPVYSKRERLRSGASVQCAAGGRCELLWPQDASSVVLFDEGWVDLGEPSRDEPLVTFRRLTRARLMLTPEDKVVLMGGAVLRGDPEEKSGPFLIERTRTDLLEITNQSKRACTLAFRDEELLLSPGEKMRLPLLGIGGDPDPRDPAEAIVEVGGREVRVVGAAEIDGVTLTAGAGGARIEDGGLIVRLAEGESLRLDVYTASTSLAPVVPGDPVDPIDPGEPGAAGDPAAVEEPESGASGEAGAPPDESPALDGGPDAPTQEPPLPDPEGATPTDPPADPPTGPPTGPPAESGDEEEPVAGEDDPPTPEEAEEPAPDDPTDPDDPHAFAAVEPMLPGPTDPRPLS